MSKITNKQFAEALYQATRSLTGAKLSATVAQFAALLSRKHKLKQAPAITRDFIKYSKKQDGIQEIEITSAGELDEKTLEKIKRAFGKNTEATLKTDPTILGGIKIKTEDKILDASVRTQLARLKQMLT
ncbi:MAG: ATP synthase F1 subunit delta [bacterium]|nr:ATP synthase F1 subunit delta [bacterium]